MNTVNVAPMPEYLRKVRPIYRHCPPPVFPDGQPTADEITLARELFAALDDASRKWYGGMAIFGGHKRRL